MSKIAVASLNPFKIKAIRDAFLNYFDEIEVKEIQVNIDTPNQPIGLGTFEGADLMARYLSKKELFQELF